jgi:hypothetical protein
MHYLRYMTSFLRRYDCFNIHSAKLPDGHQWNFYFLRSYLYSLPNIIPVIKSRRMRRAGHVARMGDKRDAYRLLVETS